MTLFMRKKAGIETHEYRFKQFHNHKIPAYTFIGYQEIPSGGKMLMFNCNICESTLMLFPEEVKANIDRISGLLDDWEQVVSNIKKANEFTSIEKEFVLKFVKEFERMNDAKEIYEELVSDTFMFELTNHLEEDLGISKEDSNDFALAIYNRLYSDYRVFTEVPFQSVGSLRFENIKKNIDKVKISTKYRGPVVSILESIAPAVWSASGLKEAKDIIISTVSGSHIDEDDKQKILNNVDKINNLLELQKYIANSILFYEGMGTKLSMRKRSQIDKQLFFDFYGVSLLSDNYLEQNPYAKQYRNMIVQSIKDVYVPLITKMVYSELRKHTDRMYNWEDWIEEFNLKNVNSLTLEQLAQIYNEGVWVTEYGGPSWGSIVESLIQLKNTSDTNQLITVIDHINDIEHNTGLMFHDFPKVKKWFSDALETKAQATPEQLIPYLSSDLQKLVIEDLRLKGKEIISPEKYITRDEKFELAQNPSTPPEILAELAKDKDEFVRINVAGNPETPPEILVELAKDIDKYVRIRVAYNPNTPPESLVELAKDEDEEVRLYIKRNPSTPPETLAELSKNTLEWERPEIKEEESFNLSMRKTSISDQEIINNTIFYFTKERIDLPKTETYIYDYLLNQHPELSSWEIERLTQKVLNILPKPVLTKVHKTAKVFTMGTPDTFESGWAIYQGNIYINYGREEHHSQWFEKFGLPTSGKAFDELVRGYSEGGRIVWYGTGDYNEFADYLPELVNALGISDPTIQMIDYTTQEFKTLAMKKETSILDYPHKYLDSEIWDLSTDPPKLKKDIKSFIMNRFIDYLVKEGLNSPELWCKEFYYTGSTATHQYQKSSDIDIHIRVDWEAYKKTNLDKAKEDAEEMRKDLLKVFWNTLNKEYLPGTSHLLTYYILSEWEDVMTQTEEAYDIQKDVWIVPPQKIPETYDTEQKIDLLQEQANYIMEKLDVELGKTKRDFVDYKVLKELLGSYEGNKADIQRLVEEKLKKVEQDLKQLQEENIKIHEERNKAFYDGQEPIEEGLSKNWTPGNIIFKLIERYKYIDILRKIKQIIKDEKITGEEEKELEDILEPKLSAELSTLWAIYNGTIYIGKQLGLLTHSTWFEEIGLPSSGYEFDKAARGYYLPDPNIIYCYENIESWNELIDNLPKLVEKLQADLNTLKIYFAKENDIPRVLKYKDLFVNASKLSMKKAKIFPGGLWAIYNGKIYTTDEEDEHDKWFEDIGLPSYGEEYDSITRGDYDSTGILWNFDTGTFEEFSDNLPKLLKILGLPSTTNVMVPKLSMRKETSVPNLILEQLDYPHSWPQKKRDDKKEKDESIGFGIFQGDYDELYDVLDSIREEIANNLCMRKTAQDISDPNKLSIQELKQFYELELQGLLTNEFVDNVLTKLIYGLQIEKERVSKDPEITGYVKKDFIAIADFYINELEKVATKSLNKKIIEIDQTIQALHLSYGFGVFQGDPDEIWETLDFIGETVWTKSKPLESNISLNMKKTADLSAAPAISDMEVPENWGVQDKTNIKLRRKNPPRHDKNDSIVEQNIVDPHIDMASLNMRKKIGQEKEEGILPKPQVTKQDLIKLYTQEAKGIYDEELMNEVISKFIQTLEECEEFWGAWMQKFGKTLILTLLQARTPQEKMIAIDRVISTVHVDGVFGEYLIIDVIGDNSFFDELHNLKISSLNFRKKAKETNLDKIDEYLFELLDEVSDGTGKEEITIDGETYLIHYEGWSSGCFPENLPEKEWEDYAAEQSNKVIDEWKEEEKNRWDIIPELSGYISGGLYGRTYTVFHLKNKKANVFYNREKKGFEGQPTDKNYYSPSLLLREDYGTPGLPSEPAKAEVADLGEDQWGESNKLKKKKLKELEFPDFNIPYGVEGGDIKQI